MILILTIVTAVFLGGLTLGVFLMVVLGIHDEERRLTHADAPHTRVGLASRRLLSTRVPDDAAEREEAGR